MKQFYLVIVFLFGLNLFAQVGINTTTPHNSSSLHIESTNSGILIPRMTTLQRNAIITPAKGLLVFDNTSSSFWFFNGTIWQELIGSKSKIIDTDLDTQIQVEKTADDDFIRFDLKGNERWRMTEGRLVPYNSRNSIAIGFESLHDDVAGSHNIANGYYTLYKNLSGSHNNANGYYALYFNKVGSYNSAIGYESMLVNVSGNYNIANGYKTLHKNYNGNYNIAFGYQSLNNNSLGSQNIAIGRDALYENLSGNNNIGNGYRALFKSIGSNNIAIGNLAGSNLTDGNNNLIIGGNSIDFPNPTGSNQLNIGNVIFGNNINGTGTTISTGNIGIGTNSPNPDAVLDISSTNSGVLLPRIALTDTSSPAPLTTDVAGMLVYNTALVGNVTPGFYYNDGNDWIKIGQQIQSQDWTLTGNSNSISGTNFIGTTNTQDLDVRTNNIIKHRFTQKGQFEFLNSGNSVFVGEKSGSNDDLSNNHNVFVGHSTGTLNTNGNENTAIGSESLMNSVVGQYNSAVGFRSLLKNTGSRNTALGHLSLQENTTGYANTATGTESLQFNTTGTKNTASGYESLNFNTTGNFNTAIGNESLYVNETGNNNTSIGKYGLRNSIDGNNNTAVGYNAGDNLTTGNNNIIIGGNSIDFPSTTASNQLNIGNVIYGTNIDGTGTTNSSGNIGIGTDNPLKKLDVNGEVAIRGGNPALGKVLTSDATGNASWEAPTASNIGGFTHYLGESYLGGIVYYLYKGSDGLEHGLIVSLTESTIRWQWLDILVNADRFEDGVYNTNRMTGPIVTYLATLGADWYLPSIDELGLLYRNRYHVQKALRASGNSLLSDDMYWSSTEYNDIYAMRFGFFYGSPSNGSKSSANTVRAIKTF